MPVDKKTQFNKYNTYTYYTRVYIYIDIKKIVNIKITFRYRLASLLMVQQQIKTIMKYVLIK